MIDLSVSTCLAQNPDLHCGLPSTFESDGDIGGRGVFYAFVAGVASSLLGALFILLTECYEYFHSGEKLNENHWAHRIRLSADTLVVSLSDTQAVTTLALLISMYMKRCSISAYHYDLVCYLVLMSSAAYTGSVVLLHKYFDTNKLLSSLRALMITAIFALAFVFFSQRTDIFPSSRPNSNVETVDGRLSTGLVLPATCFVNHPGMSGDIHNFTASAKWRENVTIAATAGNLSLNSNSSTAAALVNTTVDTFSSFPSDDNIGSTGDRVAVALLCAAFVVAALTSLALFLNKENSSVDTSSNLHKIAFFVRFGCFLTAYVIALYGLAMFAQLQHWMLYSGWFGDDDGETSMESFGQLMPLVLLFLPLLALVEQLSDTSPSQQEKSANYNMINM